MGAAIEARTRSVLAVIAPEGAPTAPLPFLMAPAFRDIYGPILRNGVMPLLVATRTMRSLELAHDWSAVEEGRFQEILAMSQNPIQEGWDHAWDSLWATRNVVVGGKMVEEPAEGGRPGGAARPAKKGGMFSRLANLFTEEVRKGASGEQREAPRRYREGGEAVGFRALIDRHGGTHGYQSPEDDDIQAIRELIRIEPAVVSRAWDEITEMHMREFKPIGVQRAEKGSLSEVMVRWIQDLPPRMGELLMIRAATDLEYCDAVFTRQLIRLCSDSMEAGQRALPLLTEYQRSLPKVIR